MGNGEFTKHMSMERLREALLEEVRSLRHEGLLTEDRIESSITFYLARSFENIAIRLEFEKRD